MSYQRHTTGNENTFHKYGEGISNLDIQLRTHMQNISRIFTNPGRQTNRKWALYKWPIDMQRFLTSSVIKKMKIKPTMRYHGSCNKLIKMKKTKPVLSRTWHNGNSGCESINKITLKTSGQFQWKLSIHIPYDSAILLLAHFHMYIHYRTYTRMFIAVLFVIVPDQKLFKCPLTKEQIYYSILIYTK